MIEKATIADWRSRSTQAMHSALDEYCPKDEFNDLLDAYEEIFKAVEGVFEFKIGAIFDENTAYRPGFKEAVNRLKVLVGKEPAP